MKKEYEAPEFHTIRLSLKDVILYSPNTPESEIGKEEETSPPFDDLFDDWNNEP